MKNKPHTTLNIKYNIDAKLNTEVAPSKETEGFAANSTTDAVNGAGDEVRMTGRKGKKHPKGLRSFRVIKWRYLFIERRQS